MRSLVDTVSPMVYRDGMTDDDSMLKHDLIAAMAGVWDDGYDDWADDADFWGSVAVKMSARGWKKT